MKKAYGASVYVSYARADEERLSIVEQLYQAYAPEWVSLKVDKDVLQPRESFKDFIEELGKADAIIVLFSDAYFESFYCMLELTRVMASENTTQRVFPIFLDDFRIDDKPRLIKNHWQQKLDAWKMPYEPLECTQEYGSESECQAIVDSCDNIFKSFAFGQAYQPDDFKLTIQWSKQRYLTACQENPAFEESIQHLSRSTSDVKSALIEQIKDSDIAFSDTNIIACLVQNHPSDLLAIIAKAQAKVETLENRQALAGLIKRLLPLLFDPAYVPFFKAEREKLTMIKVPYASYVSAEVLMASSDSRALELYVRKVSSISDANESIPGKYHLGSPPEAGEKTEQTLLEDTEQYLKDLMGDSAQPSVLLMRNQLFNAFVAGKIPGRTYSPDTKQRRINKALDKIKAHYYWIMPFDKDKIWEDFAKQLNTRYPRIIVLQLEGNDEQEEEEEDLFSPLHELISH